MMKKKRRKLQYNTIHTQWFIDLYLLYCAVCRECIVLYCIVLWEHRHMKNTNIANLWRITEIVNVLCSLCEANFNCIDSKPFWNMLLFKLTFLFIRMHSVNGKYSYFNHSIKSIDFKSKYAMNFKPFQISQCILLKTDLLVIEHL